MSVHRTCDGIRAEACENAADVHVTWMLRGVLQEPIATFWCHKHWAEMVNYLDELRGYGELRVWTERWLGMGGEVEA